MASSDPSVSSALPRRSRRPTRSVWVGDSRTGRVQIGGGAPVSVQTMTTCPTHEVDACVAEVNRLSEAGADVVRVSVPERKDTAALPAILSQTSVPIVADVHFHYQRALEAVQAGVHKIRLNPGNISDRAHVNRVIDACKGRGIPIRVGVNEGSIIERKDKQRRMEELGVFFGDREHGRLLALMVAKLEEYLDIFRERDFHDVVLSAKLMDAPEVISIYREIARRFEYPLHLGVTHAGSRTTAVVRSVAALGALLVDGVGDTLRLSYAGDPIDEVRDGLELLYSLRQRDRKGAELVACPTCGRIQVDLVSLVDRVGAKLADEITLPLKVAVMGCVVNGPGEAEGADVAVFAGNQRGIIYVQGQKVANVPEAEILDRLLKECRGLQSRVQSGEAKLGEKVVTIIPPDPLPRSPGRTGLTVGRT